MTGEKRILPGTVYAGAAGPSAPVVYLIDSPEHPLGVRPPRDLHATVVLLPIPNWHDLLTPWPAEGLYREEPPFAGLAAQTLEELTRDAIPAAEKAAGLRPRARAICGYSLGGLFALHSLTQGSGFDACACLSGSVWYEGWMEHLRSLSLDLQDTFAFLSVGTKEKRAARPILRTVERNMEECARILGALGCRTRYQTGPGNHLYNVNERIETGLRALDEWYRR